MKHIVMVLTAVTIAAALPGCGHDDVKTMAYDPISSTWLNPTGLIESRWSSSRPA